MARTDHGHQIPGTLWTPLPEGASVARCGGFHLCRKCFQDGREYPEFCELYNEHGDSIGASEPLSEDMIKDIMDNAKPEPQRPFVRWTDVVIEEEVDHVKSSGGYLPAQSFTSWTAEFEGAVYNPDETIQDGNGVKMKRTANTYKEAKDALAAAFDKNGWDVR